ncbi:hypothetical protein [Roseibium aggregatum]|uniref:hypothetical protein n=1 Tax=Roseibium aggregatum TaxID=187304 RepID=UPI001E385C03|nr:hypothetical protein [Roseibium aggregatum]UES51183.1 hypothetical protein GFK88_17125 [Roseibium aggregatum]
MPTDVATTHNNIPKPHEDNDLDYDMGRIILALDLIDVLVFSINTALAGKAATGHQHAIADIEGLQNQLAVLADRVSNVSVTLDALEDTNVSDATQGMLLQYLTGKWTAIVAKAAFFGVDPIAGLTANNVQEALANLQATKANQADIQAALDNLVGAAPGTLDTLNELATALGNDPDFATTIAGQIAGKLGTGDKAADSELLDGLDSSQFMRSNTSGTISGHLTVTGHVYATGYLYINRDNVGDAWIVFYDDNSNTERTFGWDDSANAFVAEENDGGYHKLALVYDGSSANETNLPIGHVIWCENGSANRNGSQTCRLYDGDSRQYSCNGSGSVLSGTWRRRGGNIFQRVS